MMMKGIEDGIETPRDTGEKAKLSAVMGLTDDQLEGIAAAGGTQKAGAAALELLRDKDEEKNL
jgi:hypothetical protein